MFKFSGSQRGKKKKRRGHILIGDSTTQRIWERARGWAAGVSSQDPEGPREDRLLSTRKHLPRPLNA